MTEPIRVGAVLYDPKVSVIWDIIGSFFAEHGCPIDVSFYASYELQDWLRLNDLPRVFVARVAAGGIADLRAYGAHEQPLTDHPTGEEGMWIGSRWIPPL